MDYKNLDILSRYIEDQATFANLDIQGPVEIEYGFGWEPTITYWLENRRIHFYLNFEYVDNKFIGFKDFFTLEISEIQSEQINQTKINMEQELKKKKRKKKKLVKQEKTRDSIVMRALIKTTEEAWEIIEKFLFQNCSFDELTGHDWISDNLDHDKFIPHPPNKHNEWNIAEFVKSMDEREN